MDAGNCGWLPSTLIECVVVVCFGRTGGDFGLFLPYVVTRQGSRAAHWFQIEGVSGNRFGNAFSRRIRAWTPHLLLPVTPKKNIPRVRPPHYFRCQTARRDRATIGWCCYLFLTHFRDGIPTRNPCPSLREWAAARRTDDSSLATQICQQLLFACQTLPSPFLLQRAIFESRPRVKGR